MNLGFTLYETFRRLLLLGVGVGVLGIVLAPADEARNPAQIAAMETPAEQAPVGAELDRVPQKTLI